MFRLPPSPGYGHLRTGTGQLTQGILLEAHRSNVQLLLTGDELMSGDTVDSNSAMIARHLATLDLSPQRRVTLGDDAAAIAAELRSMCRDSAAVVINGGLGPTEDDLTARIVADVAGVALAEHPEALTTLADWCAARGLELSDANRKQAILPEGCTLLPNPVGSAPGFAIDVTGCLVLCTPGVPGELRAMLPVLTERLGERIATPRRRLVLRLQTFGLGESTAQQLIRDNCPDWPAEVTLSFRAGAPQLEIKLTVESAEDLPLRAACREQLDALFGEHILGEGDATLAERTIELARNQGLTISCAESCTGGAIASMITRVPGSSDVFPGGLVTYSNAMKARWLGVSEDTLERHGAVSEATVREMLAGLLRQSDADLGVAVSGIAGPAGGTDDKPVGLVWLAWGCRSNVEAVCLHWPVERTLFQTMVAAAGLDMLRRRLAGISSQPRYFAQRQYRPGANPAN